MLGLRDRVIGSDEKMGQDCWKSGYARSIPITGRVSPVRAGIMQSPTSLTCRPLRLFGAAALHNRALRIIRVLQLFAKRGVRKGDSPGTSPRWLGARTSEWPAPEPATHSSPPRRPSAKAPACRHQQIRNRPSLANRPDLRPSHPSVKITLNQVRLDDLTHPSRKLTLSANSSFEDWRSTVFFLVASALTFGKEK